MSRLLERLRLIAREEAMRVVNMQVKPRYGNVVAYDLATHRAKVKLQPDNVTTNWINVDSPWIGNGWGMFAPLNEGDQVKVVFPAYGDNEGAIVSRFFDARNPPPKGAKAGEFWLAHQTGSLLRLSADGDAALHSTSLVKVGDIQQPLKKIVIETFQALFNEHSHGGGPPPDSPMTDAHMTVFVKGN